MNQEPLPFPAAPPPKTALILDTETNGVDARPQIIVEVAAILYSLEFGTPIESYSHIIERPSGTISDPTVPRITGIFDDDLRMGGPPTAVWERVVKMSCAADVILAHNVAFDRPLCEADPLFAQNCADYWAKPRPWVCTMTHVEWPDRESGASQSLAALALHYGVGVVSAHRAMADCDILSRTLSRVKELGHDLQALIASAMVPRVKVQAVVSYEKRDLAKDAGFAWDSDNKRWWREVTAEQRAKLPFGTREIKT